MKYSKLKIKRVTINPKSKKKRYIYLDEKNKQINDEETLSRIKKLVIPPAYSDIKISNDSNHYLQAIGIDEKGRKQYIYKKSFIEKQSKNKYCQLKHIGEKISEIRKDVRATMLSDKSISDKEKIIALVIYILDHCYFRIGNIHYFNEHKSHGVSTLQTNHLKFKESEVEIEFIGKKGVVNNCILKDPLSIKLLKDLSKLTKNEKRENDFIFYYKDEENRLQLIKPIDINLFLNKYHSDITLKMFRTWGANYIFLEEVIKKKKEFMDIIGFSNNKIENEIENESGVEKTNKKSKNKKQILKENEKLIKEVLQTIAMRLHNTPTVSKKSYLDNNLIQIYLSNPKIFWKKINKSQNKEDLNMLLREFLNHNCENKNDKTKKNNKQKGGFSFYSTVYFK